MVSSIRGLTAIIGVTNPEAQIQRPVASGPIQAAVSTTLSSSTSTTVSESTRALMTSHLVEERKSSVISQSSKEESKESMLTQELLVLQKVGAVAASLQMTSTSSSQAASTSSLSSASTSTSSTPVVRSKEELWTLLNQQTTAQLALLNASEKDFLLSKNEVNIPVSLSMTGGCVRRTAIKDREINKFLNANYISYEGVRINFVGSLFVPTTRSNNWKFIFNQEYTVLDLVEARSVISYPIEVGKEYNLQDLVQVPQNKFFFHLGTYPLNFHLKG